MSSQWNRGQSINTPEEALELHRSDAAAWWLDSIDPEGHYLHPVSDEELLGMAQLWKGDYYYAYENGEEVLRTIAPPEKWLQAYRYAHEAACDRYGLRARCNEADDGSDAWYVENPLGGTWWPDEDAEREILAAEEPAECVVRICREQPMRGEWAS